MAPESVGALSRLSSVEVRRAERIGRLGRPAAVVMVGGMCAGKSTLAHGAASHADLAGKVVVARRCATRPPRQGDDVDGVMLLGWTEFKELVAANAFALSWERPMKDGSRIGYGCLPSGDERLPILMAGHGVYSNPGSVQPRGVLDGMLIVGVAAPDEVRAARLHKRNPDVVARGPEATTALLAHDDAAMADNVDVLVTNYGEHERSAIGDMTVLLRILISAS